MASRRKYVKLEEAIDFVLNSDIGGLSSDEESYLDCQSKNNDNLEDLR